MICCGSKAFASVMSLQLSLDAPMLLPFDNLYSAIPTNLSFYLYFSILCLFVFRKTYPDDVFGLAALSLLFSDIFLDIRRS